MTPSESKVLIERWLHLKLDEHADIQELSKYPKFPLTIWRDNAPWVSDDFVRGIEEDEAARIRAEMAANRGLKEPECLEPGESIRTGMGARDIASHRFMKPIEFASGAHIADDPSWAQPLVRALLAESGVEIEERTPGFKAFERFVYNAYAELLAAVRNREEVGWRRWSDNDPAQRLIDRIDGSPLAEVMSAKLPGPVAGVTLLEAGDGHISEALKKGTFSEGRAGEVSVAVRTFISWLGRTPNLTEVTDRIAGEYRKEMTFYPTNGGKLAAYRDLSASDRIERSKAVGETRTISSTTLNGNYIDPLRGLFDWAKSTGQVTSNPFDGIKVKVSRSAKTSEVADRSDFTIPQLQTLFDSTLFTGSASGKGRRLYSPGAYRVDDWRYWLPLMALFSGARLNELCGLSLADFDVADDFDFFHVRVAKTKAGIRIVPLHPELITLGLMDRVQRLRREGGERLFPSLPAGPRGYLSHEPTKFFGRLIDRTIGKDQPVVFHSFRHTFITAMRRAGVVKDVRVRLVGHEPGDSTPLDTHDRYGDEATNRLMDAVRRVEWPGLDLSRVRLPVP